MGFIYITKTNPGRLINFVKPQNIVDCWIKKLEKKRKEGNVLFNVPCILEMLISRKEGIYYLTMHSA